MRGRDEGQPNSSRRENPRPQQRSRWRPPSGFSLVVDPDVEERMRHWTIRRGDIWYVRLSDPSSRREARGTEMGAGHHGPCVVVSADPFNEKRDRITVLPLTHYSNAKEDTMARWAATVTCGRGYQPVIGSWQNADNPSLETSIVDCAQLWTVFKAPPSTVDEVVLPNGHRTDLDALNDVEWQGRTAQLTVRGLIDIESALQVLVSGCVRLSTPAAPDKYESPRDDFFRFQEGDVIELDLPGWGPSKALVISAAPIDRLRSWIPAKKSYFGQVAVVPLVPTSLFISGHVVGRTKVRVGDFIAICQEPYTIDWRARPPVGGKPLFRVPLAELDAVRQGLRLYLGLPQCHLERGGL